MMYHLAGLNDGTGDLNRWFTNEKKAIEEYEKVDKTRPTAMLVRYRIDALYNVKTKEWES